MRKDLKRCQVDKDWREIAQDHSGWTAVVDKMVQELNREAEEVEKQKKDERKSKGGKESYLKLRLIYNVGRVDVFSVPRTKLDSLTTRDRDTGTQLWRP